MIAGKEGLPTKSMIDAYRNDWTHDHPMWMDSMVKYIYKNPNESG